MLLYHRPDCEKPVEPEWRVFDLGATLTTTETEALEVECRRDELYRLRHRVVTLEEFSDGACKGPAENSSQERLLELYGEHLAEKLPPTVLGMATQEVAVGLVSIASNAFRMMKANHPSLAKEPDWFLRDGEVVSRVGCGYHSQGAPVSESSSKLEHEGVGVVYVNRLASWAELEKAILEAYHRYVEFNPIFLVVVVSDRSTAFVRWRPGSLESTSILPLLPPGKHSQKVYRCSLKGDSKTLVPGPNCSFLQPSKENLRRIYRALISIFDGHCSKGSRLDCFGEELYFVVCNIQRCFLFTVQNLHEEWRGRDCKKASRLPVRVKRQGHATSTARTKGSPQSRSLGRCVGCRERALQRRSCNTLHDRSRKRTKGVAKLLG